MPSLDNIATKVVELQEKLFEQNLKHVLVGYKYFSDKKKSDENRIKLISSYGSSKSRPLKDDRERLDALSNYLRELEKALGINDSFLEG